MGKLLKAIVYQDDMEFERVDEKPTAYIYKYKVEGSSRETFEVFKRKRDESNNEVYPSDDDFGETAFSFGTLNEAIIQFNKM